MNDELMKDEEVELIYCVSLVLIIQMVQAFTHLAAFVDGFSGGKFRLLEGNVHGQFAELVRITFF